MTLLGLGVRTVSFLGIRVYSVAFYADLSKVDIKVRAYASLLWRWHLSDYGYRHYANVKMQTNVLNC